MEPALPFDADTVVTDMPYLLLCALFMDEVQRMEKDPSKQKGLPMCVWYQFESYQRDFKMYPDLDQVAALHWLNSHQDAGPRVKKIKR